MKSDSNSLDVQASGRYLDLQQDPVRNAGEILAVEMIGELDGPIEVRLDRSVVQLAGWRPGDAVALEASGPHPETGVGRIVIRPARDGESGELIDEFDRLTRRDDRAVDLCEIHGPCFSWQAPKRWRETFFPGTHDPAATDTTFPTGRTWLLSELEISPGRVEISVEPAWTAS